MNKALKFIATTDGTQIRLFPQNYSILVKGGERWRLDIDPGVPKALAILIFGEYHTNHDLRWGNKDTALAILNELL